MARKKRPLEEEGSITEEPPKDKAWWRKTDGELLSDRVSEIKNTLGLTKVALDDKDREQLVEELRRSDPSIKNLLDAVFVRVGTVKPDGKFLTTPIYKTSRGESIAKVLRLKTHRRIRLDDYGWAVWELLDGERNLESVGIGLKERFGDKVEPLYPRLAKFITYLANLGLIKDINRP